MKNVLEVEFDGLFNTTHDPWINSTNELYDRRYDR